MTLIDGDKIITTQLYNDEYEEYTEEKMSIIDYVNAYTDEGVTTANDILGKLRAEIEQLKHQNTDVSGYRWWNNAIDNCLHIIDDYEAESES